MVMIENNVRTNAAIVVELFGVLVENLCDGRAKEGVNTVSLESVDFR